MDDPVGAISADEQPAFIRARRPVTATGLPSNGTLVVCNDGSIWASFPNGEEQRVWVEGTPIPGTRRAVERANEDVV